MRLFVEFARGECREAAVRHRKQVGGFAAGGAPVSQLSMPSDGVISW